MYNGITLLHSKDCHNFVNQLYFNFKKKQNSKKNCIRGYLPSLDQNLPVKMR